MSFFNVSESSFRTNNVTEDGASMNDTDDTTINTGTGIVLFSSEDEEYVEETGGSFKISFFTEPVVWYIMYGLLIGLVAWLNHIFFIPHRLSANVRKSVNFILLACIYIPALYVTELINCASDNDCRERKEYVPFSFVVLSIFCEWVYIAIGSSLFVWITSHCKDSQDHALSCIFSLLLASGTIALYAFVIWGDNSEKNIGAADNVLVLPIDGVAYSAAYLASSWFIATILCVDVDDYTKSNAKRDELKLEAINIYQNLKIPIYKPLIVLAAQLLLLLLYQSSYNLAGDSKVTEDVNPAFYFCSVIVLMAHIVTKDPLKDMKSSQKFWGLEFERSQYKSTTEKLSLLMRFYADVYVNFIFLIFIYIILPLHMSLQDTPLEFVLNSVAIFYAYELDDNREPNGKHQEGEFESLTSNMPSKDEGGVESLMGDKSDNIRFVKFVESLTSNMPSKDEGEVESLMSNKSDKCDEENQPKNLSENSHKQ
mmetsp:Transcript_29363/g.44808  ORF Transcript_29363/g.44808 Transcript_29363/m.44808 type:complete len:483 (-) Transcript_29363:276-1724(-)